MLYLLFLSMLFAREGVTIQSFEGALVQVNGMIRLFSLLEVV